MKKIILMIMLLLVGSLFYIIPNAKAEIAQAVEPLIYVGYSKVTINPDLAGGYIPLRGYANTQNRLGNEIIEDRRN